MRLRVLAGPSPESLTPIPLSVNSTTPHTISSPLFCGQVIVNVKGFIDEHGSPLESEYFAREDRRGVTWSIQVQGRFLETFNADDILFGNTFDRPLNLPWGSGAVFKFMQYIDPTLDHDLTSSRPWALSPLISTMPNFAHKRLLSDVSVLPAFPPTNSIKDDFSDLHLALRNKDGQQKSIEFLNASQRREYFADKEHRREVSFGPSDLITTDFCYGFLSFSPSLALNLPGGLSWDLTRHWDGQPVRFVCRQKMAVSLPNQHEEGDEGKLVSEDGEGEPSERMFWCVTIELAD